MTDLLPERRALQRLQADVARSNTMLNRSDPVPQLRFDLRGRCAGQALPQSWVIRLHAGLLKQHGDSFIDETVPHEWAHLLAYAVYGPRIRPHGSQWKKIMRLLGCKPEVCHNYAVKPARKLRHHAYYCGCQSHELSSIRHRRVLAGQAYVCRKCGEVLKPGDATRSAC